MAHPAGADHLDHRLGKVGPAGSCSGGQDQNAIRDVEQAGQMIDPLTAFAVAQGAIKGIQAAIKMGKDINGISGDLMKFFEAKDVIAKESVKKKKSFGKSDTAVAFETVMQLKQLQDAENELKQMLIWSGNDDVWNALMLERNRMVAERKKAEAEKAQAKALRAKEINDILTFGLWAALVAVVIGLTAWFTWQLVGDT